MTNKTQLLSAQIPQETYWEFKKCAAKNHVKIKDAVLQAAILYIKKEGGNINE